MKNTQWKLFPGFLLGLLAMLAVGCGVGALLGAHPGLLKLHWGIWLAVTVLFPILALILHGRAEQIPTLYLLSYFTNAAGAGCAFGVALGYLDVPFVGPVILMLLISLALPAALALLMCLAYNLFQRDRIVAIVFTALGLAASFGSLFLAKWNGVVALGAGFGFLFFLALPIACGKARSKPWAANEYLSYAGFGAYLVVLVGAISILLEDGPDGLFDGLFDGIADLSDTIPDPKRRQQQ